MAGEIVLFQGGGCEDRFGIEEAGKLRYQCFSLCRLMLALIIGQRYYISRYRVCVPFRANLEWWLRFLFHLL